MFSYDAIGRSLLRGEALLPGPTLGTGLPKNKDRTSKTLLNSDADEPFKDVSEVHITVYFKMFFLSKDTFGSV